MSNHSISSNAPSEIEFLPITYSIRPLFLLIVDPVEGLVATVDMPTVTSLWYWHPIHPRFYACHAGDDASNRKTRNPLPFLWSLGVIAEVPLCADLESVW